MTAREIGLWIMKTYPRECEEKRRRSSSRIVPLDSDDALLQQIVAEIGSQRPQLELKNPCLRTVEGRPRKYCLTADRATLPITPAEGRSEQEIVVADVQQRELDLYPVLAHYMGVEHRVHIKRIDERRASNNRGRNGNQWLYPDLVGMEVLSEGWHPELQDCARQYAEKRTRLWSFEVKKSLNSSNIRESFFQTVSNSSWANLGYLVAAEIVGSDTMKELRLLSALHGIGIIELETKNPTESQIIIPAKERVDIDWDNLNRLAVENKDVIDYVKLVRQFYQTNDPRRRDWAYDFD